MRFFKRGSGEADLETRLATFWAWWAGAKVGVARDIPVRTVALRTAEISSAVAGIDKRLAWELAKGQSSEHMLIVTPEGNAEVRPIALAWLQSAPPADPTWEYRASRQPGEPRTLQVAGAAVELSEMRAVASWDETREVLDVRLWHPAFDGLPEQVRGQIVFLSMDNLLGEDDVERWIGAIELDPAAVTGLTPDELKAEVRRRAASATGDMWTLAEGQDNRDNPILVRYTPTVKRIDHPYASHHVAVVVDGGLKHAGDQDRRRLVTAAEEELDGSLSGVAILMAIVTTMDRRTAHFVSENPDSALEIAREWAGRYPELTPQISVESDPTWAFRRAYAG